MKSILIVDDNPGHALLTLEAFNEFFIIDQIDRVPTGTEALNYLFRRGKYASRTGANPNLILLDLNMPSPDGYEVLEKIKTDTTFRRIPVVMLSLSEAEQDINRCYELGANAYVAKQFDYDRYKKEIKSIGEFWGFTNKGPTVAST